MIKFNKLKYFVSILSLVAIGSNKLQAENAITNTEISYNDVSGEILPIVEKQGFENSLSKTAIPSASSEHPGFLAKNATDNDDKTEWKAEPADPTNNYLQLIFPKQQSISRAEIHFTLPFATRGKGYPAEIQYADRTGKWITLSSEMTYGKIWAKPIDKILTDKLRVKSMCVGISQFDVYNTVK